MRQSAPRRQHYVPQWYLRRFRGSSAKAGQSYVTAYDRQRNTEHRWQNVQNIAVEKNIYTLESPDQPDAYSIEKKLARRDAFDSGLTARILGRGNVAHDDVREVKELIAFQYFRTRWFREVLRALYRREAQPELAAEMARTGPPVTWSAERKAEFWQFVEELSEGKWIAPRGEDGLLEMQFTVYSPFLAGLDTFREFVVVRLPYSGFVTSDAPVIVRQAGYPEWGTVVSIGLGNAEDLWLPLDPRHGLLATRASPGCSTLFDLPIEQILAINNALMRASDRWTIWQPGSPADQFLDLPKNRTLHGKRR